MKTKKWATSILALSMICSLSAAPAFAKGHGEHHDNGNHFGWYKAQVNFEDIDDGYSWAKQSIMKLAKEGIFRGVDTFHFQPAGKLNRAQFAVLISRYFGLHPASTTQEDFKDVHVGDWYFNDIEAAKGYMTMFVDTQGGYDFKPDQPINRAEAAVTLVQSLLKSNTVQLVTADQANQILSVYKDANLIPQHLRIHVATAVQAGVITGVAKDHFDPLSTLNRAQAAALLYRLQSQLEVLPIDPVTGEPIELPPGDTSTGDTNTTGPVITYDSSSYNLTIGDSVKVKSSLAGSVYMVPSTTSATLSALESAVSSDLGSKAVVGQSDVNNDVTFSTTNLAAGTYTIYAVDLAGNISKVSTNVTLSAAATTGPVITYTSPSYNVTIGNSVTVKSSLAGTVYLVPSNTSATLSALETAVSSDLGSKVIVSQSDVNNNVTLSTTGLAAGTYTIYATDLAGNINKLSTNVTLAAQSAISSVSLQSKSVDANGVTTVTAAVNTTNVANNTPATFELVDANGASLNPSVAAQATVVSNTASATLNLPATAASGNYHVKVSVAGLTDQSLTFSK